MLDPHWIREKPEVLRAELAKKKFGSDLGTLLELDARRRESIREAETRRAGQKAANVEMAALEKGSEAFRAKVAEMKELSARVKEAEATAREADRAWEEACLELPNVPHPEAPVGRGEEDNVEVRRGGPDPGSFPVAAIHDELPGMGRLLDMERGVRVTGGGFPFYRGPLARLVRVLVDWFLDENARRGYEELLAPLLVNADSARATGQLPDKEGQMYTVPGDELYLIPTAEVPVTNFYRGEILPAAELPLKHCAHTPCFRREAGSWGAHVRGLNRLHQFDKVEIVRWERPEDGEAAHQELLRDAEVLLQELGLPYRVLEICTGDMGFPHHRQYDLEVWAAGQGRWLEVSSCSHFTDFQARRANIRFRREPGAKPEYVHTLNGSALAVPRVLAALLENGYDGAGAVQLPAVLADRMGQETLPLP